MFAATTYRLQASTAGAKFIKATKGPRASNKVLTGEPTMRAMAVLVSSTRRVGRTDCPVTRALQHIEGANIIGGIATSGSHYRSNAGVDEPRNPQTRQNVLTICQLRNSSACVLREVERLEQ